jgi:hypothetical protein
VALLALRVFDNGVEEVADIAATRSNRAVNAQVGIEHGGECTGWWLNVVG